MKITLGPSLPQDTYLTVASYYTVSADLGHDDHDIYQVVECMAGLLTAWGFAQKSVIDGFAQYLEDHTDMS